MKNFFRSFGYALNGIITTIKKERNIKIQLIAALIAIGAGIFFQISRLEWLTLITIIGAIISLEVKNTATEQLCDLINNELDLDRAPTRYPRDMAAGAVLVLAITSILIGLIIFGPRLTALLS